MRILQTGLLLLTLTTAACNSLGDIKVMTDEFKGATVGTVRLQHESLEGHGMFDTKTKSIVTYALEYKDFKYTRFTFDAICWEGKLSGGTLDEKVFIKVGRDIFELTGKERRAGATASDGASMHRHPKNGHKKTTGNIIYQASVKADLDPAMARKILESTTMSIRMYYKSESLTFKLDSEDLAVLKNMILRTSGNY